MFQTNFIKKNSNTFYIQQVFSENRVVYEMMWKNVAELGRPKMAISRLRIEFWIAKVTNTHTHFPPQQLLYKLASLLSLCA